jgi:hypothetical protein
MKHLSINSSIVFAFALVVCTPILAKRPNILVATLGSPQDRSGAVALQLVATFDNPYRTGLETYIRKNADGTIGFSIGQETLGGLYAGNFRAFEHRINCKTRRSEPPNSSPLSSYYEPEIIKAICGLNPEELEKLTK